jgi:hypothetical protein
LVFHYRTELDERVAPKPGENIAEAQWFEVNRLPASEDMAHHGWGRDVLEEMGISRGGA